MSYTFDKFMERISKEENARNSKIEKGSPGITDEKIREIDPNRGRIAGRETWQNRTRGSWVDR
jgi:hypothetical protein